MTDPITTPPLDLTALRETAQWRPVAGYEGLYEVSSHGDVRSLDRTLSDGRRWPGQPMKPYLNEKGYMQIVLSRAGHQQVILIHRMVLEAFAGPRPLGMEGCHINGNGSDNRFKNLRWGTPKSNANDRDRHGTTARSERNGGAKLITDQVRQIRATINSGESQRSVARRFGVSQSTVWRAIHTHWKAVA